MKTSLFRVSLFVFACLALFRSPVFAAEKAAAEKTAPIPVPIVLTFDDGPHAASSLSKNDTERILRTLQNNTVHPKIVGAFFVQTYCGRMGNGKTSPGTIEVRHEYADGNVVGIHTGSRGDHIRHTIRVRQAPEDIDGNGIIDSRDGKNGLDSDMLRAKRRLGDVTGHPTLYVRPVQGLTDAKVLAVYAAENLSYIRWNVDSHDNYPPRPSPDRVQVFLRQGIKSALIDNHHKALIILFHDINGKTAANLATYIATIDHAVRHVGRVPEFTTSRDEVEKVFHDNAEPLVPRAARRSGKGKSEPQRKQPALG